MRVNETVQNVHFSYASFFPIAVVVSISSAIFTTFSFYCSCLRFKWHEWTSQPTRCNERYETFEGDAVLLQINIHFRLVDSQRNRYASTHTLTHTLAWGQPNEKNTFYSFLSMVLFYCISFPIFFSLLSSWIPNYYSIVTFSISFYFFSLAPVLVLFSSFCCFVWLFHGLNSWWIEFSGSNTSNNCHFECYWKMIDMWIVRANKRMNKRTNEGTSIEEMKNERCLVDVFKSIRACVRCMPVICHI